jgi:hypothetical protein
MPSSKKSTTSKKQAAARAPKSNGNGKVVSRDADAGRSIEKANGHMERAWGKIYEQSGKAGASKK